MSDYSDERDLLITKISTITKQPELKPLILKLCEVVANGLIKRKPEAINQAKIVLGEGRFSGDPTSLKNVSKIIKHLKAKHFPTVSTRWIEMTLPEEYKEPRTTVKTEKSLDIDAISDKQLIDKGQELTRRYKKLMNHGPAQEIKVKKSSDGMMNNDFECDLTKVVVDIAFNIEEDYKAGKLDKEMIKALTRRFKTIADRRFSTDEQKYEAIILACGTVDSLNNSTKYETQILSRWEVFDRERKCRKCLGDSSGCRAEKCGCACHETVKRLTPKGLKWATDHNPHLKKLDKHITRLSKWEDDICAFAKILLNNPHIDDYMKPKAKRNIMANHINKDKCDVCEFFLESHQDFFEENK